MKKQMTEEEIVAALPRGAQARLAKEFGVSKQFMNKILLLKVDWNKQQKVFSKAQKIAMQAQTRAKCILLDLEYQAKADLIRGKIMLMGDIELVKLLSDVILETSKENNNVPVPTSDNL